MTRKQKSHIVAKSERQLKTTVLNFLRRFSKKDLIANILPKNVEKQDIYIKERKPLVIKKTLEILMEKFSNGEDLILFLHLQYAVCVKKEKIWIVLQIKNAKRLTSRLTAEKVSTSIHKYFTKYNTECKVFSEMEGCFIWIVLLLECNRFPVYCIVHMKLSLIFICNVTPTSSFLTEKVLRKTFRGSDIKKLTEFKTKPENITSIKSLKSLYKETAATDKGDNTFNSVTEDIDSEVQSPKKRLKRIEESDKNSKQVRQIEFEESEPVIQDNGGIIKDYDKESQQVRRTEFEKSGKKSKLVRQIEFEKCEEESGPFFQDDVGIIKKYDKESKLVRQTEFKKSEPIIQDNVGKVYDKVSKPVEQTEFEESVENSEPVTQIEFEESESVIQDNRDISKECNKQSDPVIQVLEYAVTSCGETERGKRDKLLLTLFKFQGTDVLKGLDKLKECGIIDASLPDYLYEQLQSGKIKQIIR